MKKLIKHSLERISRVMGFSANISVRDLLIQQGYLSRTETHPNPFARYGARCFSQNDEDGLTMEIVRRLGIEKGSFIEFGVGNGLENNTLVLLASGWKGAWFGGQDLIIDPGQSERLSFEKVWVTRENIARLCTSADQRFGKPDLVSMDLDGNDYHLVEEMLRKGVLPAVFIVEYNGRFLPPIEFIIDYNSSHTWKNDDYFGASLASFNKLFEQYGYMLICCNAATGVNAFFVRGEYAPLFTEVPEDLKDIFSAPFRFRPTGYAHRQSTRTIEKIIRG